MRFTSRFLLTALTSVFMFSPNAHAAQGVIQLMDFSKVGDLELSCGALSTEAAAMRSVIIDEQDIEDKAKLQGHGVNAVAGLGGLLIGTMTGGIGFAAAGLLATEAIDDGAQDARSVIYTAAQRRSLMIGIYRAKSCQGPIEHVMLPAESVQMAQSKQQQGLASKPETLNNLSPAAGQVRSSHLTHND